MSDEKLGLIGAMSISVGGMIGGGVYAVLGVVVLQAGAASWLAFTGACLISMGASYSYIKLNRISGKKGGSVTQIEAFTGRSTLAGMIGWTLLFGYIGAMAMYAFAFGGFTLELLHSTGLVDADAVRGVPVQPALSVLVIGAIVGLVVAGTKVTGWVETALATTKSVIILGFGLWGFAYGFGTFGFEPVAPIQFGFEQLTTPVPIIIATAISFVSFQGWQLLVYDQESIRNPERNVPLAIYASIVITIILDGMIAILVFSYAGIDQIVANPEVAVAFAAQTFIGPAGFFIIAVSALLSTGSAILGTLFSSAHFAKGMIRAGLLPDRTGNTDVGGAPPRTTVLLGVFTGVLVMIGGLEGIISFASLMFMVVFGAMSYLALQQRHRDDVNSVPPLVGVVGSFGSFPILVWHMYTNEPAVFGTVVVTAVAVFAVESIYFGRETIWAGLEQGGRTVADFAADRRTGTEAPLNEESSER
ncbi:MAG: APC family permease [Halolamina sp.]